MRLPAMVITLTVTALVTPCRAQPAPGRQPVASLFVEAGGNAAFGATVNVEAFVARDVALRAGIGGDFWYSATTVVPFQAVYILGQGHSTLETAAGITIAHEPAQYRGNWHWDGTKPFFTGFIGYRYQRGGLLFRIGVVPLMWTNNSIPWIAIALGGTI